MSLKTTPGRSKRAVLGMLFLSTGAALVIYIISGISLIAALFIVVMAAVLVGVSLWRRHKGAHSGFLYSRFRIGLLAGFLATILFKFAVPPLFSAIGWENGVDVLHCACPSGLIPQI